MSPTMLALPPCSLTQRLKHGRGRAFCFLKKRLPIFAEVTQKIALGNFLGNHDFWRNNAIYRLYIYIGYPVTQK